MSSANGAAVYVIATLDTKGEEAAFVRDRLVQSGVATRLVDVGSLGDPRVAPDVSREEVFGAASGENISTDRGEAVTAAAKGATRIVLDAYERGELAGVLALGGSAGTAIGTQAMRALPLGLPKLMVSTLASGDVRSYVGDKDIVMINSVVDILGLNRISRPVFRQAADAMAGMVRFAREHENAEGTDRPMVAATMFGVTTRCVERAREILEDAGYEVLVFHATGNGGRAMESLIRDGFFAGVLDLTTTELADEIVGGVLSAGPERGTAAGEKGTPQVVSVGATDMVNFRALDSVPVEFAKRNLHVHNPEVTLMRTTAAENERIGDELGTKLARASGPTTCLLPLRGVSALDQVGEAFDDPEAREALFDSLRKASGSTTILELDLHINDPEFAAAAAQELIELMEETA